MGANSLSILAKPPVSRADGGLQGSTLPLDALNLYVAVLYGISGL